MKMGETQLESLMGEWKTQGIAGVEVYHPSADAEAQTRWLRLAKELGLMVGGGSDFHAIPDRFPTQLGIWQVHYDDVKDVIEWK